MPKTSFHYRIGLSLGERSFTAIVLRPEGRLHAISAPLEAAAPLDASLAQSLEAALPDDVRQALAAAQKQTEPEASPSAEDAAAVEIVLSSTRPFLTSPAKSRVALLATSGFEDVLWLDAGHRCDGEAMPRNFPLPSPTELCQKELCLGVPERLSEGGAVLRPLTPDALTALTNAIAERQPAAVAVMLLHSYQNDAHERTVAQALAPLGLPVSLSSVVARVPDERLRAVATVLDAGLSPAHKRELAALRGLGFSRVLCSESLGSVAPMEQARPLRRILTPPTAGLRGAQRIAAAQGLSRFVALGIDEDARFATVALWDPDPTLEFDLARRLGPIMGADVGPDAGSGTRIDVPLQELQIVEIGEACDGDAGAARLQDRLLAALFAITLERGHDPSRYPLLCYGRIEPLLAATLAERLGAESILIPPAPRLVEAYGALCAPLVCQRRELLFVEASSAQQTGQVAATRQALTERLRADLRKSGHLLPEHGSSHIADHLPGHEWFAEMRYEGQGQGISPVQSLVLAGLGDGGPAVSGDTDLVVRFCEEHRRRYGFTLAEYPVKLEALRVRATLPVATPSYSEFAKLAAAWK
jgi:N-methylhydantoinase A/oxoprolinase/acetone carboxylase beta subunit